MCKRAVATVEAVVAIREVVGIRVASAAVKGPRVPGQALPRFTRTVSR